MERLIVKCAACVHNKDGVCEIDNREVVRPDESSCTSAFSGKRRPRPALDQFWDGDDSGLLTDE